MQQSVLAPTQTVVQQSVLAGVSVNVGFRGDLWCISDDVGETSYRDVDLSERRWSESVSIGPARSRIGDVSRLV